MELDILHRATSPEIVEFYGAFFIESCVYYCMEYMDAGSLDKLQGAGVPEDVLARITASMVRGLKFLKDELQIMHRGALPRCHRRVERQQLISRLSPRQMSSRQTCSSTRPGLSSCATLASRVSLNGRSPKPISGAKATWR